MSFNKSMLPLMLVLPICSTYAADNTNSMQPTDPAVQTGTSNPNTTGSSTSSTTNHGAIIAPSKSMIMEAQQALTERGFSVSSDGRVGPATSSAIRRFQSQNGLTQSGMLDAPTLNALGISGEDFERSPASVPEGY